MPPARNTTRADLTKHHPVLAQRRVSLGRLGSCHKARRSSRLAQLRDDLERFAFLPGGSDGESLFNPAPG